ncbi:NADPH2:quinone reductase [Metabacillus crassostreae]|uniref:quinone oxidoreductase family protein n=1 Tax=Metabacillus crassostreae TaxID=929098 RepID=UPI00195B8BC5|nr:quinone oxidoreductase [Metabacillus crassostreae]MBM7602741.1 NADPH2:quinone reductase [Metabacillus crassostreae]
MKALVMEGFGGAEVLKYKEVPYPVIENGDILVRTEAIGLNFADIYRRRGGYKLEGNILGYEGAGIVEKVGEDITDYKVGDRVGFADVPYANAEYVKVPKDQAIPLPKHISFETAASILLQGLTTDFLIHDSFKVQEKHTVVIHAVSGGVGQLLLQMVKNKGAKAIGITSTEKKKEMALNLGADAVFLRSEEWKNLIMKCNNGGADVVYDGIGSTLLDSLSIVKPGGTVVFYGTAGGDPAPIDPKMLIAQSKTLAGGDLWKMVTESEDRINRSNRLFDLITRNKIILSSPTIFPLPQGSEAHRFLESGQSTGKVLLIP